MNDSSGETDHTRTLAEKLATFKQAILDAWQATGVVMRNELRIVRQVRFDYTIMRIGGPLPERSGPARSYFQRLLPLPSEHLSMQRLNARLQAVADAGNIKGVVFIFDGFEIGLATAQNVRRAIERLRASGKEAIVYTPYLDLLHYYVASAAGRIVAPATARFEVLGLNTQAIFLKDALANLGIQAEIIQISPYKTAGDMLSRSDISPEQREQLEWLLDDNYDLVTQGMADGRSLNQAELQALVDQAPLDAAAAKAARLIDDVAYEDEIAYLLADEGNDDQSELADSAGQAERNGAEAAPDEAGDERPKANLQPWSKVYGQLLEKARRPVDKFIGVVSLEGTITMGSSRQPPLELPIPFMGGVSAGEQTVIRLLRAAGRHDDLAALILHVDSPGGSALASDLIWREVERFSKKKPVLVFMGNVAASGGYYVSAAAQHIMCQSGAITGSIGVITGRVSTKALFDKVDINTVTLSRGRHATLNSATEPLTAEERQILWRDVVGTYESFKRVVATGRELPYEELDPICEGRVWTGRQALCRKLVDSHGDFIDASRKAAELAGLPTDDSHYVPVANYYVHSSSSFLLRPFAGLSELIRFLTGLVQGRLPLAPSSQLPMQLLNGRPLLLMPYKIRFW